MLIDAVRQRDLEREMACCGHSSRLHEEHQTNTGLLEVKCCYAAALSNSVTRGMVWCGVLCCAVC